MEGSVLFDDYEIIINKDKNAEGEYYIAKISELETIADGSTCEEAIRNLEEVTMIALEIAKDNHMRVPKPVKRKCSGNISLRAPKYLHEKLSDRAREEGVSINQLIVSALSWFLGAKDPIKQEITIHNHYNTRINNGRIVSSQKKYNNNQWGRSYA